MRGYGFGLLRKWVKARMFEPAIEQDVLALVLENGV
jgi:hypothetical protein